MADEKRPHVSATQLEMFWTCGERYRRRYMEGEIIPPGIALIVGTGYHKGAEHNFRQKIESHADLPKNQIVEAAVAGFEAQTAGAYALTEEEAARGAKAVLGEAKDVTVQVAEAYAKHQAPDYQPIAVEHTTRIILSKATHDLLGVTDLRDDQGRVTDLKTASKKQPQSAADTSTQLTIYAAAYQIDTGQPPSEVRLDTITKTKVPARQVLQSQRTKVDFQVLLNRINKTLELIQKGAFAPASPGAWQCSAKWCGFALTCPYFNPERDGSSHE